MPKQPSYQVRGIFHRRCPIKDRNEINQTRTTINSSKVKKSGHAHHCEALLLGDRRTRPTRKGASRNRKNNAPPPCENLQDRLFFNWTSPCPVSQIDREMYILSIRPISLPQRG